MTDATIHHGDCLTALRDLPDASVDAVVTDPPYGLSNTTPAQVTETITRWASGEREYLPSARGFMGHEWDGFVPPVAVWDECLRVLKPGGHLLAFAGSRTQDLMGLAVRLAGFEIRDSVAWLYGSGFPKSLDVSKAIDRARDDKDATLAVTAALADMAEAAGITRADVDAHMGTSDMGGWWLSRLRHRCSCPSVENWTRLRDFIPGAPALDEQVWHLNGRKGEPGEAWALRPITQEAKSALRPGEHISFDQRSSKDRERRDTPATDAARRWEGWGTALKPAHEPIILARKPLTGTVAANVLERGTGALNIDGSRIGGPSGRWPANVVLDESQAEVLDEQSGVLKSGAVKSTHRRTTAGGNGRTHGAMKGVTGPEREASEGGASRFFYVAKAPKSERPVVDGTAHPTVKPVTLMRWLVRMVTPPGGTVLDPFAGSGTTLEAAVLEGFDALGVEREADYLPLIHARIDRAMKATEQGSFNFKEDA